jgi:NAD(P)H-dependent FMN reductase
MRLQGIIGSTRPGRAADKVIPWITSQAALHPAFEPEVVDLRDW